MAAAVGLVVARPFKSTILKLGGWGRPKTTDLCRRNYSQRGWPPFFGGQMDLREVWQILRDGICIEAFEHARDLHRRPQASSVMPDALMYGPTQPAPPSASVTPVHRLVAIARNRWSRSIVVGGRNQS